MIPCMWWFWISKLDKDSFVISQIHKTVGILSLKKTTFISNKQQIFFHNFTVATKLTYDVGEKTWWNGNETEVRMGVIYYVETKYKCRSINA